MSHEAAIRTAMRTTPRLALVEPDRYSALPFDVLEPKVRVPLARPGVVHRVALVNRLRATASVPVVTIIAPAGYGKTTLLVQWIEHESRPCAWSSLDERDNDPVILLRHIAAALHPVVRFDAGVLDALRSPKGSIWRAALPRLLSAVSSCAQPFVFVLDDVDRLQPGDSADTVAALAEHLPPRSTLVVAGRAVPRLPVASLRARGRLLEIGPALLALTAREAQLVLRSVEVELPEATETELFERTEGWAAAVYLAALATKERSGDGINITGDDWYLADYIRTEYLADLNAEHVEFLRRTSVLKELCPSLCDDVLERKDSVLELEAIGGTKLVLVPLDRRREWVRQHHLVRDLLRRELRERDPELVTTLNRRAARWFERHGDLGSALQHAHAADDTDHVGRLLVDIGIGVCSVARSAIVDRWLSSVDYRKQLERCAGPSALAAWIHALRGDTSVVERWLHAAEERESSEPLDRRRSRRPWIALIRAASFRDGTEQMLSDAERAVVELPSRSRWRPAALLLHGTALAIHGDYDDGDAILAGAATAAANVGAVDTRIAALAQRVLVAERRNNHAAAEALVLELRNLLSAGPLDEGMASALALAVSARVMVRRGDIAEAQAALSRAHQIRASVTCGLPWLTVQIDLELAAVHAALRDAEAARALLAVIDATLQYLPDVGELASARNDLQHALDALPHTGVAEALNLTGAELRLLPFLATHMSFPEIGARLGVSRNTIKTQAVSIYRKLGVTSRSEAVQRAAELRLLEDLDLGKIVASGVVLLEPN